MAEPLIILRGISKVFPGVRALDNIDLEIYKGEVHALVGENGAGKSTLIKILTGAFPNDAGQIFVEGREVKIHNPREAMRLGITAIYQELNIVPQLTVAENVFLGREVKKHGNWGLLDYNYMNSKAKELLKSLGQDINPTIPVGTLGVGKQQMVEIAKALCLNTKLLIMDEPTAALTSKEVKELLKTVRNLRERGIAIIFISHRLDEVLEISDRITIMRDGKKVGTFKNGEITKDEIIRHMVGRTLDQQYPKQPAKIGREALRVEGLTKKGVFENISFYVREGEILGIAGLVGAGRTEVAKAIFGAYLVDKGEIYVFGKKVTINSPIDAIRLGIAYLSEDRKNEGLVLGNTVDFNVDLPYLNKSYKKPLLNLRELSNITREYIRNLRINPPTEKFVVRQMSGGNQQKVVIAKWLNTKAKIFIFDEPTRGIDVGAKVEVYNIMNKLVAEGNAIIMISSEMPEILGMSDRIIVMHEGKVTGEFTRGEANQEIIMKAASGGI